MKRIALIAGRGRLPSIFASEARKAGEYIVGLAIEGITPRELQTQVDKIYWVRIDETKRALEILRSEKINSIVMTGKIPKAVIFNRKLNLTDEASEVFKKSVDSKDYTLIKGVASILKKEGMRVIDPTPYFSKLFQKKGLIARRSPTKDEWADIHFGAKIAKKISGMDIGQAVAVKRRMIITVEAVEGTDRAIRRIADLEKGEGAVIVKVSRPRQDMRFDVPAIGPDTIDSMIAAKASCLAVEAHKTLVVDKDEIVRKADSAGIAVLAI
ncbi:MAG: LpxI family protein [Candidatus Omnitrophica bacterium]|nr:LpxI family protein [Candidatus Omnitrophota bacterium]